MRGLALVALWALAALAQRSEDEDASITEAPTASTPSANPEPSSGPATHTIAVGASGHRFTESETFAEVGDILEFLFYPANHSVVRAEYRYPCVPYEMIGVGRVGFNSGFHPVRAITNDPPAWRIRVNDTDPIFFYCGADGSCYKNHMIAVVNPNENQTLESHLEAAEGLTFQVLPGEPYPEESGFAPPTRPTPSGDSNNNEDDEDNSSTQTPSSGNQDSDSGLGAGEIAGIAIGSAAVLLIAGALIFLCGRRGGLDMAHRRSTFTPHHPSNVSEANYSMGTKSPEIDSRWSAARWSLKSPTSLYRDQASPPMLAPISGSPVHMAGHPHPAYGGAPGVESQHSELPQHAGFVPVTPAYAFRPPPSSPPPPSFSSLANDGMNSSDPRLSQARSPPPATAPSPTPRSPVELPSESGQSPGQGRYSWMGHESEAGFRASR